MFLPLLEMKGVTFAYPNSSSLFSNLSFSIYSGEYVGIVGANGSGKTTLIQLMLGLKKPKSGTIKLFNKNLDSFKDWQNIGYVPQYIQQKRTFPATVYEIVSSAFVNKFWLNNQEKSAVKEAMQRSGIWDLKDKILGELSGGQIQRTFIARSLVNKPKLLILDEPTAGVDAKSQELFYQFLKDINTIHQVGIVLVNHDIHTIKQQTQRCIYLESGIVNTHFE